MVEDLIDEDILIFLGRNDLMKCYYFLKDYLWDDKIDIKIIEELDKKVATFVRDNRTKEEFLVGLILNKVIEIFISEYFKHKKYMLAGSDRNNLITYKKTHYPDLLSKEDNSLLEVSSSYSLFAICL